MSAIPESATCPECGGPTCPECGGPAQRKISAPSVSHQSTGAMKLQDATRSTAEAPSVVRSVPGRRRHGNRFTTDPRHSKLSRP